MIWLGNLNSARVFFCFHATNQFSFILFIFYSIYKVTTQHSWWNVMLASFGTWVRTPGPPSYFHIFLLNVVLCSLLPEAYHAASWLGLPHVPWHQSNGPDLKPMEWFSQCLRTWSPRSQQGQELNGPNYWDKPPIWGQHPPLVCINSSFFFILFLFYLFYFSFSSIHKLIFS